jgi:cobalt/nickel transport system ATP-binding protein
MVLETCERTIVLSDGKIMADGPTREIITDEDLMDRCGLEAAR